MLRRRPVPGRSPWGSVRPPAGGEAGVDPREPTDSAPASQPEPSAEDLSGEWLSVPEAAFILDKSKDQVRKDAKEGKIPARKEGREWRVLISTG